MGRITRTVLRPRNYMFCHVSSCYVMLCPQWWSIIFNLNGFQIHLVLKSFDSGDLHRCVPLTDASQFSRVSATFSSVEYFDMSLPFGIRQALTRLLAGCPGVSCFLCIFSNCLDVPQFSSAPNRLMRAKHQLSTAFRARAEFFDSPRLY